MNISIFGETRGTRLGSGRTRGLNRSMRSEGRNDTGFDSCEVRLGNDDKLEDCSCCTAVSELIQRRLRDVGWKWLCDTP